MYKPTRGSITFIYDALSSAMLALYDDAADTESLADVLMDALKELEELQEWAAQYVVDDDFAMGDDEQRAQDLEFYTPDDGPLGLWDDDYED
jgi:hypothetical protein